VPVATFLGHSIAFIPNNGVAADVSRLKLAPEIPHKAAHEMHNLVTMEEARLIIVKDSKSGYSK
jgi:hypothetical protein